MPPPNMKKASDESKGSAVNCNGKWVTLPAIQGAVQGQTWVKAQGYDKKKYTGQVAQISADGMMLVKMVDSDHSVVPGCVFKTCKKPSKTVCKRAEDENMMDLIRALQSELFQMQSQNQQLAASVAELRAALQEDEEDEES